jgi:hypothetical protein
VAISGAHRTLAGSTINTVSTVDGGGFNLAIAGNADIDGAVTNVALGNNNYVLTADSATASGVKWAAAASAADPTPTSLMLMGG